MIAQNYWALNITNVYLKLPSPGLEMFLLYSTCLLNISLKEAYVWCKYREHLLCKLYHSVVFCWMGLKSWMLGACWPLDGSVWQVMKERDFQIYATQTWNTDLQFRDDITQRIILMTIVLYYFIYLLE